MFRQRASTAHCLPHRIAHETRRFGRPQAVAAPSEPTSVVCARCVSVSQGVHFVMRVAQSSLECSPARDVGESTVVPSPCPLPLVRPGVQKRDFMCMTPKKSVVSCRGKGRGGGILCIRWSWLAHARCVYTSISEGDHVTVLISRLRVGRREGASPGAAARDQRTRSIYRKYVRRELRPT